MIEIEEAMLIQIFSHRRNYSQPYYFFRINQSSDTGIHGFGAKFLLQIFVSE